MDQRPALPFVVTLWTVFWRYRTAWFLGLTALGLLIVYGWFLPFAKTAGDTEAYLADAQRLLSGSWREIGNPPLLPILLAISLRLGLPIASLIILNILLVILSASLLCRFIQTHFSEVAGYFAAIIFGLTPVVADYTLSVLTDALAISLSILTLTVAARRRSPLTVFLCFASAVLAKYLSIILFPYLVLRYLQRRDYRQLSQFLALCLAAGLLVWLAIPSAFQVLFGPFAGVLRLLVSGQFVAPTVLQQAARATFGSLGFLTNYVAFFALYGFARSVLTRWRSDYPFYGYLLALVGVVYFLGQNWQDRFFLPAFPIYLAFMGHGFSEFFFRRQHLFSLLASAVAVVFLDFYNELLRETSLTWRLTTVLFPFGLIVYLVVFSLIRRQPRWSWLVVVFSALVGLTVFGTLLVRPSWQLTQETLPILSSRAWVFRPSLR